MTRTGCFADVNGQAGALLAQLLSLKELEGASLTNTPMGMHAEVVRDSMGNTVPMRQLQLLVWSMHPTGVALYFAF